VGRDTPRRNNLTGEEADAVIRQYDDKTLHLGLNEDWDRPQALRRLAAKGVAGTKPQRPATAFAGLVPELARADVGRLRLFVVEMGLRGFADVAEVDVIKKIFGTLSIYRGTEEVTGILGRRLRSTGTVLPTGSSRRASSLSRCSRTS
jgi:hypothetical protein